MITKTLTLLSIFIALLSIYSCNTSKQIDQNDHWSLELKKGGCMDVCQSYDFSINQNGDYAYKGKFKVKHRGVKSGKISKQDFVDLKGLLKSIQWESLKETYHEPALDSQKNLLSYNSESVKKNISFGQIIPKDLTRLENFINTLINQDDF